MGGEQEYVEILPVLRNYCCCEGLGYLGNWVYLGHYKSALRTATLNDSSFAGRVMAHTQGVKPGKTSKPDSYNDSKFDLKKL